jgi:antitoxin CptB
MYNIITMSNKLEIFKKRLIYRASYRGTKEMDILLGSFVNKHINDFDENNLKELEKFLNYEDEIILNFYNYNIDEKKINKNKISILFKNHKI